MKGRSEEDRLACSVGDTLIYIAPKCAKRQDRATREDQGQFEQSLRVEDDGEQADWTANYVLPDELDLTTGSQHFQKACPELITTLMTAHNTQV